MYSEDIPKYSVRKQSSTSKANRKSKHKHLYKECLFKTRDNHLYKGTYCTICSKVGKVEFFSWDIDNSYYNMTDEQVRLYYPEFEVLNINNLSDKEVMR